jgi:hypothetical protein
VKDTTNVETHISRTKSTNGTLELNAPVRQNDQPKVQISQENHRDHEVANKNTSGSISTRIQDNGNASIDTDKSNCNTESSKTNYFLENGQASTKRHKPEKSQ